MRYNPKAKLDRSQVQVRRGGSSGGGSGMRMPGGGSGMRVGGGIGGVIVLVLVFVLQSQFGGGSESPADSGEQTSSLDNCQTGDDANQDASCALLADVNSIQAFWAEALP